MIQIRSILCPIDLSGTSRHALDHAAALAGWYEAKVHVLHVVDIAAPPVAMYEPSPVLVETRTLQQVREEVKTLVMPLQQAGVRVDVQVEEGAPVREILRREEQADLIVMGTHGRGGFERLVLGSVAEKVLRKATRPVMTIPLPAGHAPSPATFKRILCPVDFSESSMKALRYALSLAGEANARLTLVHVVEWFAADAPTAFAPFDVRAFRNTIEQESLQRLRQAVPAEARDWCEPEEVLLAGRPYQEILRLAAEREADLIVMGVEGRNPVDVMLFGSTTNQVVRRASCPVLTVRG